jgi:hypothetical protein
VKHFEEVDSPVIPPGKGLSQFTGFKKDEVHGKRSAATAISFIFLLPNQRIQALQGIYRHKAVPFKFILMCLEAGVYARPPPAIPHSNIPGTKRRYFLYRRRESPFKGRMVSHKKSQPKGCVDNSDTI